MIWRQDLLTYGVKNRVDEHNERMCYNFCAIFDDSARTGETSIKDTLKEYMSMESLF